MAVTVQNVIDYARAVADQDSASQISDTQCIVLLKPLYWRIRKKLANRVPFLYRKTATQFTISSGNTQDVTAAPLSLTDFGSVRRILRVTGSGTGDKTPVGFAGEANPEAVPSDQDYVYLQRGNVLEFFPSQTVPGTTFELSYLSQPVTITVVGDAIDMPDGFQEVLGELLASKFRLRFEEQVSLHVAAAMSAMTDILWDMIGNNIQPEGLNEVTVR